MSKSRNRRYRVIILVALISSLFCITVGYSAFRERIEVKTKTVLKGYNWKINFSNIKDVRLVGGAKELSKPILTATEIDLEVELNSDEDAAIYTFDIVNDGSLDAVLTYDPIIDIEPSTYANNLKVDLSYSDGTKVLKNDILNAKTKVTVNLEVTYTPTLEVLERPETSLNMSSVFIYAQK